MSGIVVLERGGHTWRANSFDQTECEITRDGQTILEWNEGKITFNGTRITEQDLATSLDVLAEWKRKVLK